MKPRKIQQNREKYEITDILENSDFDQKIIFSWKCEACVKKYKNVDKIISF